MNLKPKICLAMPIYGCPEPEAIESFYGASTSGRFDIHPAKIGSSLLPHAFNMLWAAALNMDADYFAMLHADVGADVGWLDVLYDEMEEYDADVVSVVLPIKGGNGLTSVAVENDNCDQWNPRRLSLTEVAKLPASFFIGTVQRTMGFPDRNMGGPPRMLVNTGCMLCNLRKVWARAETPAGELEVDFGFDTRIAFSDGRFTPQVLSEDWRFCRSIYRSLETADPPQSPTIMATTKVQAVHYGRAGFPNYTE